MSNIRRIILSLVVVVGVFGASGTVGAQEAIPEDTTEQADYICMTTAAISQAENSTCDLAVQKDVSVNDGEFQSADSEDQAAFAAVGDTITWRITVSNTSTGAYLPTATIVLQDILPAGVSYESHVASSGTFDANTGKWVVPTASESGEEFVEYSSLLPATLTLTTTVTEQGTWENIARLTAWWCDGDYECTYADMNASNNQDSAFLIVQDPVIFQTQVLGASTDDPEVLAATGNSNGFAISVVGLLLVGAVARLARIKITPSVK